METPGRREFRPESRRRSRSRPAGLGPFVQQKPSQGAQIVEQPAARLQVLLQFVQLELHDAQSFHAAIVACGRVEVGCNLALGFGDGLDQDDGCIVGILDTVKRVCDSIETPTPSMQPALADSTLRTLPWLIAVAFFMESLDTTILNTGVPTIAAALHVAP
jgi:hypothetical protein